MISIVYCEIDSLLPELPCFEFLRSRKFRVKTIKLRGQVSQGIVFPLSVIKEVDPSFNLSDIKDGQNLTEILKITKYDPELLLDKEFEYVKRSWLERKIQFIKWKLFGFKPSKSGDFPSDVPKTDEIRVQKMGSLLFQKVGCPVYISEKMEGTSATFLYRQDGNWLSCLLGQGYIFQACSRNRIVYNSQKSKKIVHHIMQVSEKYNIEQKLRKLGRNIAIQSEVIGGKIQGNIYKLPGLELRVFSIFDIDKQQYCSYQELINSNTAIRFADCSNLE